MERLSCAPVQSPIDSAGGGVGVGFGVAAGGAVLTTGGTVTTGGAVGATVEVAAGVSVGEGVAAVALGVGGTAVKSGAAEGDEAGVAADALQPAMSRASVPAITTRRANQTIRGMTASGLRMFYLLNADPSARKVRGTYWIGGQFSQRRRSPSRCRAEKTSRRDDGGSSAQPAGQEALST
jgi:hypothetical protein